MPDATTKVLLNTAAGTVVRGDAAAISRALAACLDAEIEHHDGPGLMKRLDELAGDDATERVIVGGGDGSINSAAERLLGSGKALGVLPLGTLNYLARELDLPEGHEAAAQALCRAREEPLPVGQITAADGTRRVFSLFGEIGLYAHVVRHRDAQRKARGRGKYLAMVISLAKQVRRFRNPKYVFELEDGRRVVRRTPIVYLGLSDFHMRKLGLPAELERGRGALTLILAKTQTRLGLVRELVRASVNRLKVGRDLDAIQSDRITIRTVKPRRTLRVALDGEVADLAQPIVVERLPDALKVLRPLAQDAEPETVLSSARKTVKQLVSAT